MPIPELIITLTPEQIAALLGFSIGFLWGEAFSGFDGQVKYGNGDKWDEKEGWERFIIGGLLDANHHFQYGLVLMLMVMRPSRIWILDWTWLKVHPTISLILLWIGWGLIVSDWKDWRHVLERLGMSLSGEDSEDTETTIEKPEG